MIKKTVVLLLLVMPAICRAQNERRTIGMIDLTFTLTFDIRNRDSVKIAWDDTHAVATLQGIVNRKHPRLYVFLVKNAGIDIDRYWWNKYREKGGWLYGRDTVLYKDVVSLIT